MSKSDNQYDPEKYDERYYGKGVHDPNSCCHCDSCIDPTYCFSHACPAGYRNDKNGNGKPGPITYQNCGIELREKIYEQLKEENTKLKEEYAKLKEENEKLQEENAVTLTKQLLFYNYD